MKTLNVTDFTEFPGPRFMHLGPNSGEEFRKKYLLPTIKELGSNFSVNLDGTMGYGSSFLEEAFGGLVRENVPANIVLEISAHLQSEDPSLVEEIVSYVNDAIEARNVSH